jgi:4-diphosphocytidyl-2-C-methyl-D-erythritol kinase
MIFASMPGGLRVLAPAKLNLYLEVGPRRPDGFHDIDSVFQAVTLYDEIEVLATQDGSISLVEEGIGEGEKNLVLRAARRLRESGLLPASRSSRAGARIRLRKRIPQGAGLGGGSSDAAATLLALARLWEIDAGEDLPRLAAELGSDVPFFLVGGTCRCRGRGEIVTSWNDALPPDEPFHYVIAFPRVQVPTARAFAALDALRGPSFTLTAPSPLDSMPPAIVLSQFRSGTLYYNRFESVVYDVFPEVKAVRDTMSQEPFVKVLLSGSGSAVYGVSHSREASKRLLDGLEGRIEADLVGARTAPPVGPGFPTIPSGSS